MERINLKSETQMRKNAERCRNVIWVVVYKAEGAEIDGNRKWGASETRIQSRTRREKTVEKEEDEEQESVGTEGGSGRRYYIETGTEAKEGKTRGHLEQQELLR